jgi:hypothetical protein
MKAMSEAAISLATCNAVVLLRDVNLSNTRFHHICPSVRFSLIKQSPVITIS